MITIINIEITGETNSCWPLWWLEPWEIQEYDLAKMPQSDENMAATTELESPRAPNISSSLTISLLLFCNEMKRFEHHSDFTLPLVSLFVSLWHALRTAFFPIMYNPLLPQYSPTTQKSTSFHMFTQFYVSFCSIDKTTFNEEKK